MVFSSLVFLFLFFPVTIGVYFLMPNRTFKNLWLLIASLFFYAWGEPRYILIMLLSTVNDYVFSQLIDASKQKQQQGRARLFLVLSLSVNLGLLAFFKYAGFFTSNINHVFGTTFPLHQLPLPIGISFYTFQTMSYSIDVYLGNVKVQKNFLTLATYVTMFPQLIAGPIVRYITVERELEERVESLPLAAHGLRRFVIGLGKKVIIANHMGLIADTIFQNGFEAPGTALVWLGAIAYTFQIYYDFSGYSDMAIGIGNILGFHFLENFNYPYIAKSVTDFWRRWHISLSTWFKDYVYIPLGGNRKRLYRNIFIVWCLTGLWHGASWNYVIWGLYYGLLLMIEKKYLSKHLVKMPLPLQHLYTLFIVIIGWIIFRLEDFTMLKHTLGALFVYTPVSKNSIYFIYQDMLYAIPFLLLATVGSLPLYKRLNAYIEQSSQHWAKYAMDLYLVIVLVLSIALLVGDSFNPFIYYRF